MTEQTRAPAGGPTALATVPRPRLYYLDNLRITLTVLVVLHHVAVTYGHIPVWFYTEPADDPTGSVLDAFVTVNQSFFMGFFFLISGFFTPSSHDRKGGRAFLRGRLVRLGIPLLVFLVLLRPMVNFGSIGAARERFAEHGVDMSYWLFYVVSWDPGPMWFAEVLLVFAVGYVLVRRVRGGAPTTVPSVPARAPGLSAVAGFVVVLTLVTFAWRQMVPAGAYWPVVGLPSPAYLPQYAAMFVAGTYAFRRGWFTCLPRRAVWFGQVATLVGALGFLAAALVPGGWRPLVSAGAECAIAVGIITCLLVLFQRRFNTQGPRGRFLSDHAFTVYITHPLVLVAAGYAFAWLDAPAIAKFALVGALALPTCWVLAYLVRALPHAKRVL